MAKRKTLEEMNLLDDFLNNAMATTEGVNEEYFRIVLGVLLEREIKHIQIACQKPIFGVIPGERGIRMDVEITETDDHEKILTVYDWEPHLQRDINFAKHARYYQAKIDSKHMSSGDNNFASLPELYLITITDFDIFGIDHMIMDFEMSCVHDLSIKYNSGVHHIYFNTNGTICNSESIRNMLKYLQETNDQYAVDSATRRVNELVASVKDSDEVRSGYMTWDDVINREKAESFGEGFGEGFDKGRFMCVVDAVHKKLLKGVSDPGTIADELEQDLPLITFICEQFLPYAPEYNLPEDFVIPEK